MALAFSFAFLQHGRLGNFLADLVESINKESPPTPLENPPPVIKAVYATGWSAGSKGYQNYLRELFATTQINAVVIDIKDVSGYLSYKSGTKKVREYRAHEKKIANIDKLINDLHSQGIYVIAKIAVFKDLALAKSRPGLAIYDKTLTQDVTKPVLWRDNNGMFWVDPSSSGVADYNIEIAKEVASHGFDEINFDYIRFPSDGKLKNMGFPFWDQKTKRNIIIKDFFKKAHEALPNTKLSVDIFGLTTVSSDDMGIGQIFEDALDYFDYVSPMLYPSHYSRGFLGYENPAQHPYEVVTYSLDMAIAKRAKYLASNEALASLNESPNKRSAKIRPWLQDFTLRGTYYDAKMVKEEIRALSDSMGEDFNGFLLWNQLNFYTKDAIIPLVK